MCLSPHFALAVEASPGGTVGNFITHHSTPLFPMVLSDGEEETTQ